jgi:Tol biopolymer transport system component
MDLWVQPLNGAEARRLTFAEYGWCRSLSWSPDGSEIIYNCQGIFRVRLVGGQPQHVVGMGQGARDPSIREGRMVYAQGSGGAGTDIWRIPGRKSPSTERVPERLIASSRGDLNPDYSPDSRRIAFASSRTGVSNIWICDSDGSNPIQLTDFSKESGTPRWAPDGERLVFDSFEMGNLDLWVVDVDGGMPQQVTHGPSEDSAGTWSRDGQWIYFGSDRSGSQQIWKIPGGGGPAVQVTRGGGHYAEESWDRRYLYYTKDAPSGIWRVPVEGGEEIEVLPGPVPMFWDWTLSKTGIYFATWHYRRSRKADQIQYFDFESGKITELFSKDDPSLHMCLTVSPDEEWVLYGERPAPTSELMLVENFR